jgi:predicted permease
VLADLRYILRSLSRQPGFVVFTVLSLALGIGVNTATFSAVNALLLRPVAVRDLDRTVIVFHASPDNPDRGTSFPAYQHYRGRTDTFSAVMAVGGARPLVHAEGDRRDQVYAELVAGDFFSMADVSVRLGRPLDPGIDRTADPQFVAVLSHAFWKRRFASDPAIVGKAIVLNGRPFAISGVSEPGFTGLDREVSVDLWIPMTTWAHLVNEPARLASDEHWLTTVGRLGDDVTIAQAQAAMTIAGRALPPSPDRQTKIRSVREPSTGSIVDTLAIGGAALAVGLLVLALACTNVANLLMARAAARQREMSVRMALGSGRARLVRLWMTESLLLSVAAGIMGLVVASVILDLVVAFKPPVLIGHSSTPTLPLTFQLDGRVLLFTICLSVVTAVAVGLVSGIPGSSSRPRFTPGFNMRSAVIALQMALSVLLLVPSGLFVRSWLGATAMDPGFSADSVLLLPISTDQAGVRVQKPAGFEQDLAARVALLPGVESATVMDPVPLWFGANRAFFSIENTATSQAPVPTGFSRIGPGYFRTLRIPLLRGRDFTSSDTGTAPPVAIVNDTMARRYWPDGDAVGRRIRNRGAVIEIVGIARDAKYTSLAETSLPWLYRPLAQEPTDNPSLSLAVRTIGDPMRSRGAIEREVKALAPAWPIFHFRTLDEGLELQRLVPRMGATLLGALGAFGLLLAAVGVYGVMAYVVKQRAHEIGIRLALGAPLSSVLTMVIRQGMTVCAAGAAIGIALSLVATRLLASFLTGVGAADPLTYTVVLLLLFGVALLACYVPARAIARMNALDVLRYE